MTSRAVGQRETSPKRWSVQQAPPQTLKLYWRETRPHNASQREKVLLAKKQLNSPDAVSCPTGLLGMMPSHVPKSRSSQGNEAGLHDSPPLGASQFSAACRVAARRRTARE